MQPELQQLKDNLLLVTYFASGPLFEQGHIIAMHDELMKNESAKTVVCFVSLTIWSDIIVDKDSSLWIHPTVAYDDVLSGYCGNAFVNGNPIKIISDAYELIRFIPQGKAFMVSFNGDGQFCQGIEFQKDI